MRTSPHSTKQAFTLVELSIVLVILGLLVGGVLTGQSLIRAAELRSVTQQYQQLQTALSSFRDKYFAVPGDMPNAVKYWNAATGGNADGLDSTCMASTTTATGTATCNGNGDGAVGWTDATNAHEWFRAWQHLANAGLIEGSFTGVAGSASNIDVNIGRNVPRSKLANGGWLMRWFGSVSGHATLFDGDYGNFLRFGTSTTNEPILKAEEAYNIDMKIDDGKPHQGKVIAQKQSGLPNCVTATNDAYLLTSTAIGCSLFFLRN